MSSIPGKIKWMVSRWGKMKHPQEDFYRIGQFTQNQILDRWSFNTKPNFEYPEDIKIFNENFLNLYTLKLRPSYAVFQTKTSSSNNAWRVEPKNKIESPVIFKSRINHKDFSLVGENKYIFELNRLHVLPAIAYHYCQQKNIETAELLNSLINSWIDENPFQKTINWKSGIEVGIRSFNLLVTRLMLSENVHAKKLCSIIDRNLELHYQFLKNHLSLYSSANNHLLKELFGLVTIASIYKFKNKGSEVNYYFKYYQDELIKQTHEDGGSKEQSIHYHAAVLNSSFLVLYFAAKCGLQPDKQFLTRLQSMCLFLDEMTLGGSQESLFGDKDDSNIILDVFASDFNLYHSLLFTGSKLFPGIQYAYFKPEHAKIDFINALFYKDLICDMANACSLRVSDYSYYKSSGYFIFKSKNTDSHLFFDVGEIGYAPLAAHGHSDLLHFTLWVESEPWIVDAGTYQYHPEFGRWRNYFRGIRSHNTISVNGQHHASSKGTMMWYDLPGIIGLDYGYYDNRFFCKAGHNSFYNKNGKIIHNRRIEMLLSSFLIHDAITGTGEFTYEYFLHFHPTISAHITGDTITLSKPGSNYDAILQNKNFEQAILDKGNNSAPLGWYSSRYDELIPTCTLKFSKSVINADEQVTEITIRKKNN